MRRYGTKDLLLTTTAQLLENAPETCRNSQEMRVKKGHPINRVLRRRASDLGWNGLVRDMRQPPPPEATKKRRGKALWGRLYVQGA